MGTERAKYFLNYDMRMMDMPELCKPSATPFHPPVYPNLEPEMNIGRDWHGYRPIQEAAIMFCAGVGGLFALAAVSSYDLTGYRGRRPWVQRSTTLPTEDGVQKTPTYFLNLPPLNPPQEGAGDEGGGDDY